MIKKIAEKIEDIFFEHLVEKLVDGREDKIIDVLNNQNAVRKYEKYKIALDEEILKKYGDESFYNDLCSVLLRDQNINRIIDRCMNRDIIDTEDTEKIIEDILGQNELDPYNKSRIRECIEYIWSKTFETFNKVCDEENIKLKNIVINEGEKTRKDIKSIGRDISEEQKRNQDKILEGISNLSQKLEEKEIYYDVAIKNNLNSAHDISRGVRNAVKHFTGRKDELKSIIDKMEWCSKNDEKLSVWIYGMGGMGKTQLCRKLYALIYEKCKYIGWISYQNNFRDSLLSSIYHDNKEGDAEKQFERVVRFINTLGRDLVLFIDNYDIKDKHLSDIEALKCHVIITSRSSNPDTFEGIKLGFLSLPECRQIFKQFYTLEDNMIMNEIIHKTGYLVLAVELIAKTGEKLGLELRDYYDLLEKKGFDLHTVVQSNWDNEGEKLTEELAKHFCIVFDLTHLKRKEEAIYILKNFSVLPYLGISHKTILKWLSLDLEKNELKNLVDFGWLELEEREYRMHPIIRFTVRKSVPVRIEDCSNLVESLTEEIRVEQGASFVERLLYLPYAEEVGRYFVDTDDKILAELFIRLAEMRRNNGEYEEAYGWGMSACRVLENVETSGHMHNLTYNIMSEICLDMRDRNQEVLTWARKAVNSDEIYSDNVDDMEKSVSWHNLACGYIQMEDNEKALEYERKAMILREKNLSQTDPRLMNTYRNYAMVARRLGKLQEAYHYQKNVVTALENLHRDNPNHPDMPVAYSVYSFILRDLEELEAAICYQKKAMEIREGINKNDPKLAINYNNLGMFYLDAGKLEDALEWEWKAIETDLRFRGPNHPDVAIDCFNYAKILLKMGKADSAVPYLCRSREIEENCKNKKRLEEIDELIDEITEEKNKNVH